MLRLAASLLGHLLAECAPTGCGTSGISPPGMLSATGHARQLDDAALDGVHEREVAHGPREQRALGVARAAQEERRGREVEDARDAELALHRFEAGNPEAGGLVVLLGFLLVVALQLFVVRLRRRLLAVAVVGLVVEHEDVLEAHEVGHDALEHLPLGFQRVQLGARAPGAGRGRPWRARFARAA